MSLLSRPAIVALEQLDEAFRTGDPWLNEDSMDIPTLAELVRERCVEVDAPPALPPRPAWTAQRSRPRAVRPARVRITSWGRRRLERVRAGRRRKMALH